MIQNISGQDFKKMLQTGEVEVVDVRERDEHDLIRIKGSKLIPMSQLNGRLNEIDWNKKVVLVCRSGSRSGMIGEILSLSGKEVLNLSGGIYELNLDKCDCLEKSEDCCDGYL